MEHLLSRYRNVCILVGVLFAQVLGLAIQVRRNTENESSRLIRVWTVSAVTPIEKVIVGIADGTSSIWHNYIYLRGVRQENRDLKQEIQDLKVQQFRLREDAEQARRLQALLGFKEQYIGKPVAAQVIGSSGSEQSRSVYIDKGASDGIRPDMPVITAEGVVGKVLYVYGSTSQVLLINDQTSGAGAILEDSRIQGIVHGTPSGELTLGKVMGDEHVQPGEKVLTSGGDDIFPKGMPIGTVSQVSTGKDSFLTVRVKPAVTLNRLEEVLVITKEVEKVPVVAEGERLRAADILARRLPSVPDKPADDPSKQGAASAKEPTKPAPAPSPSLVPNAQAAQTGQSGLHENSSKATASGNESPGIIRTSAEQKPVSEKATGAAGHASSGVQTSKSITVKPPAMTGATPSKPSTAKPAIVKPAASTPQENPSPIPQTAAPEGQPQ